MTPEEELAALEELERLEAEEAAAAAPQSPDQAKAAELEPKLDPSLPLPPQVLATQPATTHPGGDDAAQNEWSVRGTDAAKGTTFVYEPPVTVARQELSSNPELVAALFPGEEIPPEFIQQMDEDSDIYKAYADHKWNDARWAAADSGMTAYRVSRMPWLGGEGSGLSPLSGLVTKVRASVDPVFEGAQAFVLGVDDSAAFGAGRRAGEALDRATGAAGTSGDTVRGGAAVGGVGEQARAGADPEAVNEMLIEESPGLHTAGQVVGLFTPGGVMSLLGKGGTMLTRTGLEAAKRLGGGAVAQGAGVLAGATTGAVLGGAAAQAGREGVEAAANLGKTGETGTTLGDVSERIQTAALDPMNLGLGVGGELLGGAASATTKAIRDAPRFQGNVERVEQLGGKMVFHKGPVGTPRAEAAIAAGKARDVSPQDVMAQELAPRLAKAEKAVAAGESAVAKGAIDQAKKAKDAAKAGHAEFKEKYFQTREGQQVLPPVETLGTNLRMLREKVQAQPDGSLIPVGDATGVAPARAQFNADIAGVSTKPTPGAIELTPDEAEAFLSPGLTADLIPSGTVPPPAGKPPAAPTGANAQGVNVIRGEAPTVPPKGKAAKAAGYVGKPTIKLQPEIGAARNEYGEAMRPYREAQKADNARAAKLVTEIGAPLSREKAAGLAGFKDVAEMERMAADLRANGFRVTPNNLHGARILGGADRMKPNARGDVEGTGLERIVYEKDIPLLGRDVEGFGVSAVDYMAEQTGPQLGSSKGGFYRGSDGVERYVKQVSVESQALDEAANTAAYQAFGADTLQARAAKQGDQSIVYSERLGDEWKTLSQFKGKVTPEMAKGYVRGVPADVMLGSWDLANNPGNIMTDGKRIMRIDAGGMGPRSRGMDPLQAWEEGLAAFDLDSTGSAVARGELRQKWAERAGGKGAAMRAEMPYVLAKGGGAERLADVKSDLQAGLADVEKAIADAGGEAGFVQQHYPHLRGNDAKAFANELGRRLQFLRDNIDKIAMVTAIGVGSMFSEEGGAAAATAGGLAMALKKRGISKVYVTPRRYSAQQHEVRINQLKTLAENPQMPGAREARELYAAALKDRTQRSLGGRPGGWAEVQKGFSDRLTGLDAAIQGAEKAATKKEGAVLKKTPEAAQKKLVRYSQQRKGELPLKQEVEALGARAGISSELRDLRLLDPLEQLRNSLQFKPGMQRLPTTPRGILGGLTDRAALNYLYPGLKPLGDMGGPLRGGMLGVRAQQLGDNTPEKEQ